MIYVIIGPTASGKSEVAHQLSQKMNAPIINADAFQIYQGMDIGTNKIKKDDPFYHRYYLLNLIAPHQTYSIYHYQHAFREVYQKLKEEEDNIILVGGTGLYIKAALYDYTFYEEEESECYDDLSTEDIYLRLQEKDPEALKTIHPHNRKRLIRALNMVEHSAISKSENLKGQSHTYFEKDLEVRILFLNPNREELYEKINQRVESMFEEGLVEEVKNLIEKYELSRTAREAIGYKEVISYLKGEMTLEECKELMKKRTRNYAKRQVTFFKNQFEGERYENKEQLLKEIKDHG